MSMIQAKDGGGRAGGAVQSESNDRMYNILLMKNTSTSSV